MNLTENYYTKTSNYEDHTTFSGSIYNYDFDGYTSMKSIADRIMADKRFDKQCKRNVENKKYTKKGSN